MARNWLRITHQDDKIQLSWQRGLSAPRSAPPVLFEHPFDEETLTDLRWYLEKFLTIPYGIFPDKAKKIEQKFQEWGEQLFKLLFPRTTKAWDFFQEATREGLDNCEINISSDDPIVLNLPWELMYSPDYQFLAPSLAGMYRSLSGHAVRAEMGQLSQDKLNILLVIARPYGEKDVAFKTIARPMLEALKPIQKYINLKVLRPPSFEEFERELNADKGFYHIVHFDGHGNFDADSAGFQHSFGSKGQGVLVFENIDGSPQIVTAAQIAQSLNDCRVPIFVLNACKSAQEGEGSFSSVATRLVSLGAKSVVAMAYNVQVEAAKHFIGRFYQQLVAGTDVSTAVAAARRQLVNQRLRPSFTSKGDLPLADWMVPVLYQQETYTPFVPDNSTTEDILDIDNFLEETVSNLVGFPEQGRYGFIGRDYDILRLERAFRQNNIVLLQGMGGVGKTELTAGFARWLEETQGRCSETAATRSHFFFISFESGASLSRVVNEIGRAVWGDKFSQYAAEQQQKAVLNYLKQKPCLLIWDNFEPVAGFPHGNEPLLSEHERDDLKRFLKELRGGETWVLITSRREEVWLDCGYSLVNLQGLSPIDTQEFAAKILQTVGVEIKNLPEEYLDLLKLLGGHPLSLRVVLPHLQTQTPTQVIEALRQGLDSLEKKPQVARDKSLRASLDYSFSRLSEKAKRHLPFLGLLNHKVDVALLSLFSGNLHDEKQVYQKVFGENLQATDWLQILDEAAELGLLEHLDETIYQIHPTLPWYLRQRLLQCYTTQELRELETKLITVYTYLADECSQALTNDAEFAISVLQVEEYNLLQVLRLAEQQQQWAMAQAILQPLGEMYERTGRKLEFKSLRLRALKQIGTRIRDAKSRGKEAIYFWKYLRNKDANEIARSGNFDEAKSIYQEILDEQKALNDSSVNPSIAIFYNLLGNIAWEQRQFNDAIVYYGKALHIFETNGDSHRAATVYFQLGNIALEQGIFDKAVNSYKKALQIFKTTGDLYKSASCYGNLGIIAQQHQQFDDAIALYKNAIEIYEGFGDEYSTAGNYHNLGVIAEKQGNLESARIFYYKSLQIKENSGNYYRAGSDYHNLGNIALKQHNFDDATAYYQKSLRVYKEAGDEYNITDVYLMLGSLEQEKKHFDCAIEYYKKAFMGYQKFQDWYKASITLIEWGNILEKQKKWVEALRIYLHFLPLDPKYAPDLIDLRVKAWARILNHLGEIRFKAIWLEADGEECPENLRSVIWSARDALAKEQ